MIFYLIIIAVGYFEIEERGEKGKESVMLILH